MKISNLFLFAFLGLLLTVVACDSKKNEQTATEETTVSPDESAMTADPNAVASTPTTSGSEPHYKCPNNCEGGVGTAKGKCPICGTDMAHNQAFHAQAPAEPGTSPQAPITINPTNAPNPNSPVTTQQTIPAEPAQNAKGVWHFACSKNCGGGAGAAGNCPKCGSPLAHNAAYHQQ